MVAIASRNQRTPSHANGTRARLMRRDRVIPIFPSQLCTKSLPQPAAGQSPVVLLIGFSLYKSIMCPCSDEHTGLIKVLLYHELVVKSTTSHEFPEQANVCVPAVLSSCSYSPNLLQSTSCGMEAKSSLYSSSVQS